MSVTRQQHAGADFQTGCERGSILLCRSKADHGHEGAWSKSTRARLNSLFASSNFSFIANTIAESRTEVNTEFTILAKLKIARIQISVGNCIKVIEFGAEQSMQLNLNGFARKHHSVKAP